MAKVDTFHYLIIKIPSLGAENKIDFDAHRFFGFCAYIYYRPFWALYKALERLYEKEVLGWKLEFHWFLLGFLPGLGYGCRLPKVPLTFKLYILKVLWWYFTDFVDSVKYIFFLPKIWEGATITRGQLLPCPGYLQPLI